MATPVSPSPPPPIFGNISSNPNRVITFKELGEILTRWVPQVTSLVEREVITKVQHDILNNFLPQILGILSTLAQRNTHTPRNTPRNVSSEQIKSLEDQIHQLQAALISSGRHTGGYKHHTRTRQSRRI